MSIEEKVKLLIIDEVDPGGEFPADSAQLAQRIITAFEKGGIGFVEKGVKATAQSDDQ